MPGGRLGVLVAQMGGPAAGGEVAPFIRAIFSDPAMVALPGGARTRRLLAATVAATRAPAVRRRYTAIGGGSPIGTITAAQAEALRDELGRRGHDAHVAVAMRYTRPSTGDAVDALVAAGVDRLVLLPLYPQACAATSGSSTTEARRVLAERPAPPPLSVIPHWYDHPAYLDATAARVRAALGSLTVAERAAARLVFSAHGIPQRLADRGDPYPAQVAATVTGVLDRLETGPAADPSADLAADPSAAPAADLAADPSAAPAAGRAATIAYQSRTGPVRWLGPDTVEVVRNAGAEGATAVVVVPVSFVSDHIETLHELDIELAAVARQAGVGRFVRAAVLNADPEVGPILADVVEAHLAAHPFPLQEPQ